MKTFFLAAPLLLLAACASSSVPADEAAGSESALTSADAIPGVRLDATVRRLVTGVPTYGYDATTPFLALELKLADGELRAQHPGFDGLEHPFVLVPHADGTSERHELRFTGTSQEGYIALHPVDHYGLDAIRLADADLASVEAQGVTVLVETNVGILSAIVPVTEPAGW